MVDSGGFYDEKEEESKQKKEGPKGKGDFKPSLTIPITLSMVDRFVNPEGEAETRDYQTIIGRLLKKSETKTKFLFEIDDSTAVESLTWLKKGGSEGDIPSFLKNSPEFTENSQQKAVFQIRAFKTSRTLFCVHMGILKNYNEVTNHFLRILATKAKTAKK